MAKTIVNSWNEWDPLKHVIIGKADGCCIPAPEPALDAKVPQDSDMKGKYGPRTKDTIDKANELLDKFADILTMHCKEVTAHTTIEVDDNYSLRDFNMHLINSSSLLISFPFILTK